jgi:hypothetical protein
MSYEGPHPFPVTNGGTGASSFTDHGVLLGSGSGSISVTSTGSSGEVLTSNGSGSDPTFQTPSSSGILIQQVRTRTGTVQGISAVIPFDDTIPQITEGAEVTTLSITPTNSSNILLIECTITMGAGGLGAVPYATAALFRDSTANALTATTVTVQALEIQSATLVAYEAAGSTSSTTFRLRAGPDGAQTINVNGTGGAQRFGGVCNTVLVVSEISA